MNCIQRSVCFSKSGFHALKLSRNLSSSTYDVVIVGGGAVGCATARQLKQNHPKLDICLLEKEYDAAFHQSGNNSGVIHAGIYYKPGTLKAQLCVRGHKLMLDYCREKNIAHRVCGKLIIATDSQQLGALDDIFARGQANGAEGLQLLDQKGIREIEPKARGLKAIWSPNTGIVSYREVTKHYVRDFTEIGGKVFYGFRVAAVEKHRDDLLVKSDSFEEIRCRRLISCAGLYSDRISELTGGSPLPKIVPFRGEYLLLKPHRSDLVSTNIYPVPDPNLPFLGVHFTPRIDGRVILGPNAVLAFAREGYKCTEINVVELVESINYAGLQKMVAKYFMAGVQELYKGFVLSAQIDELKKFIPELELNDVERGPAGVRAQALDIDGEFVDDFVFDTGKGDFKGKALHVRNAPSPAATSSLAIAEVIADKAKHLFSL
ncbi:L-2-hydroxyglutarate dehydrogenase, mitochondrial [Galendromus occidentalis]|uniref:L-2-hydroxyglutarate dehydrogenase, mitochondrial n=1 Tax=Galendromus occidentalis TaxID=34638 RepID=A0AAJ6QSK4_9ACAR|nr:L-2-hydroxyglutarate dehydrogenase, mitochondrial [Galendromus occidentalis]